MWHDWWVAHRLEVYASCILVPLAIAVNLFIYWLDRRR